MQLGKQYVFQQRFAMIVMATFLGSDLQEIRYQAGMAVSLIYGLDPAKLYNKLKKAELAHEAWRLSTTWRDKRPDWAYFGEG